MLLASSHLEDAKRAASNGFSAACEAARREDKAATMWMSLMSSDEIRKREQSAIVLQRVWRGSRVRFQPGVLEWRAFIKFQRGAHMVRGVRALPPPHTHNTPSHRSFPTFASSVSILDLN